MTSYTELQKTSAFEGDNAAYLEALYEKYLQDPSGLSAEWQNYFAAHFQKSASEPLHSEVKKHFLTLAQTRHPSPRKTMEGKCPNDADQLKVYRLIQAYRRFGHLQAKTDPLGLMVRPMNPRLTLAYYGLSEQDTTEYDTDGLDGLT